MNTEAAAARIWIAVDALDRCSDAIGAAIRLAQGRMVELAGVFVEDDDLLRLAGWPAATETGLFELASRPFGLSEAERAMQVQAAVLHRRLEALARDVGLSSSFRTVRGRIVPQALSLAASGESVVMAAASTSVRLHSRRAPVAARPVLWLVPDDAPALRALLEAALRLDPGGTIERRLVLPEEPARAAAVSAEARRAESLRSAVPPAGTSQGRAGLRTATVSELLARGAAGALAAGDLVLMTRAGAQADPERVQRLLRRGAAPLVLV
ncbi:MAG: hypothetical protein J0H00_11785 [Burkholderiales bacterium]|nr:hypothetical protein [Burkholderiales bacterium]OJX03204.1 MAG: hypothetical protein BGO72_18275 [Burkholderiales bacterium 70-64]